MRTHQCTCSPANDLERALSSISEERQTTATATFGAGVVAGIIIVYVAFMSMDSSLPALERAAILTGVSAVTLAAGTYLTHRWAKKTVKSALREATRAHNASS